MKLERKKLGKRERERRESNQEDGFRRDAKNETKKFQMPLRMVTASSGLSRGFSTV
jgi:hypothetical protein